MPAKQTQSQTSAMGMSVAAGNPYTTLSPAIPASTESSKATTVAATSMQTTSGSSAIVIPASTTSNSMAGTNSTSSTTATADSDLAMAALLNGLGNSLGSALQAQMDRALQQK